MATGAHARKTPARVAFAAELRRFRETRRLSVDQLGTMLRVSGNYIYTMERGIHDPSATVRAAFASLADSADLLAAGVAIDLPLRSIPVVSWAQAGNATLFEEQPEAWEHSRLCRCPDLQARIVELDGDSMEPHYHAGDLVVVMPNHLPKSPCLVVAKMADGGYVFKKFSENRRKPNWFKLSSYNRAYPPRELNWGDVEWVYPVYSLLRD